MRLYKNYHEVPPEPQILRRKNLFIIILKNMILWRYFVGIGKEGYRDVGLYPILTLPDAKKLLFIPSPVVPRSRVPSPESMVQGPGPTWISSSENFMKINSLKYMKMIIIWSYSGVLYWEFYRMTMMFEILWFKIETNTSWWCNGLSVISTAL